MTHTTDNQTNASERSTVTAPKKKLIEVSLPLEAITRETQRESKVRQAKPATFHQWWSRKPLATARSVLFAQLVDDPSSNPDKFPSAAEQDIERQRLHRLMEKLASREGASDHALISQARTEIEKSNGGLPKFVDPFAGGGSIPLEAQRLGLEAHASDLNPVAALLNMAMISIPPKFSGSQPVHPNASSRTTPWYRNEGLAEDVRMYGAWLNATAFERIGYMYPKVATPQGTEHTVVAWKWARTVISPNRLNPVEVPLVNSWWLRKKSGREVYVAPVMEDGKLSFRVHDKSEGSTQEAPPGTIDRRGATVFTDGTPVSLAYVREQGRSNRIGQRMMAVAALDKRGRVYVAPDDTQEKAADVPRPEHAPDELLPEAALGFRVQNYGVTRWSDLFTNRQLVMLTTFADLVSEARDRVLADALASGMPHGEGLEDGGSDAAAYADSIAVFLGLAVDKLVDLNNSFTAWEPKAECPKHLLGNQTLSMTWDFAEANPFSGASGSFEVIIAGFVRAFNGLDFSLADVKSGDVQSADAATRSYGGMVVSTDPPYYDMIGYADLSDFFYVWLRRSLGSVVPNVLGTILTPKADELVADPNRHGASGAESFFVEGLNRTFQRIRETMRDDAPMTIYYAYKQKDSGGVSLSGWHTLLEGLIASGWQVTATWPIQTEGTGRLHALGRNALASSIVLACRPRTEDAPATTRRAFVAALKAELPAALHKLMQGSVAPVDLAQAAIGPGIAVFSRFSRVREADGSDMSVKDALLLINSTLDEVIGEQESDFDPDTRFAVKWYRQYGWAQESAGIADQLARSSDTSIGALERGGIFEAKGGKARLLPPAQLDGDWDAASDERVSVWEATVRLAAVMAKDGADKVAELLPSVQTRVNLDAVKELGFLLFHEAEKKKDTKDAILFNGLVSAWGDVNEQARKHASTPRSSQQEFDFDEDED